MAKINILFVCLGNICRSTMAEFVFKDLVQKANLQDKIYVESAGTSSCEVGNDTHHGTKNILRKYAIPFTPRSARQITSEDYEKFDYIYIMDDLNARDIRDIIPHDPAHKIAKLLTLVGKNRDVADPWYTGNFEKTYQDISSACTQLLSDLQEELTH